jgi:8-amino-7-oxononanoate synthase
VAGPEWAVESLVQRARPFIFSTAPPPPVAAAIEAALDVIAAEPERRSRLLALAGYLRERLGSLPPPPADQRVGCGPGDPPHSSQIIPVILGTNERAVEVAAELQRHGFDVRAIRPPTVPPGTARLRISVNANLSENVLDRFVACAVFS